MPSSSCTAADRRGWLLMKADRLRLVVSIVQLQPEAREVRLGLHLSFVSGLVGETSRGARSLRQPCDLVIGSGRPNRAEHLESAHFRQSGPCDAGCIGDSRLHRSICPEGLLTPASMFIQSDE